MVALIAITEILAGLLLLAREWLLITGLKLRLRLLLLMAGSKSGFRAEIRITVFIAVVVKRVHVGARRRLLLLRLVLAELFLRRCNQAEIVFGVLVVILCGDRIAGTARVTRELDVFFCNMRGGAAYFDIGSV